MDEKLAALRRQSCLCVEELSNPVEILDLRPTGTGTSEYVCNDVYNKDELDGFFNSPNSSFYLVRVYCISQIDSYSALEINEEMLGSLVFRQNVALEFCDVLSCFFYRAGATEEAYCSPLIERNEVDRTERAYHIKYAEENQKEDKREPWSIRQIGVYHQTRNEQSVWIVLHPCDGSPVSERIKSLLSNLAAQSGQQAIDESIHEVIVSPSLLQWRLYTRHYENDMRKHILTLSGVNENTLESINLEHTSLKRLRFIERRFVLCKSLLQSMDEMLKGLSKTLAGESGSRHSWLAGCQLHIRANDKNVEYLISQCQSVSQLMLDTLDFQNRWSSKSQGAHTIRLSEAAAEDSSNIRIITIITMLYLSATFVATFFGMPFFELSEDHATLVTSSQIWIYIIPAVCLTAFTIGCWMWLLKKGRQKTYVNESGELIRSPDHGVPSMPGSGLRQASPEATVRSGWASWLRKIREMQYPAKPIGTSDQHV